MSLSPLLRRAVVFAAFAASSSVAVGVELFVNWLFGFSLFRFSMAFIPIGAIILGIVGASGGIIAARHLQVRLGIVDLTAALVAGFAIVIGIFVIYYWTATIRDVNARQTMSFYDFLPLSIGLRNLPWLF